MPVQMLHGNTLELPVVQQENLTSLDSIIKIPIEFNNSRDELCFSENLLSKHFLIIGGIGSGKTNLFKYIIHSLSESMTNQDVMVIFDTKGEYVKEFYQHGDIIIANDDSLFPPRYNIDYWNIFEEILIDQKNIKENVNEISKTLFYEQLTHTNNPFFPNAAKDIFFAYILANVRKHLLDQNVKINNRELSSFFNQVDAENLDSLFRQYPDLKSICNYTSNKGQQTQGVLSETVRLVRDIFTGNFEKEGNLSIRKAVREKGNRKIFIEYDLGIGNVLSPIYRLLIDLAIKESLCRDKSEGNVYFVLDEFRLLPHLQHVDDGINFGRSQGAKFIIGMQNIQQINEAYGHNIAGSILSGLSSKFIFRVNDAETREYVKNLLGKNRFVETYYSQDTTRGLIEQIIDGNTAEDWLINRLPAGTAIYSAAGDLPKIIKTYEYGKPLPEVSVPSSPVFNIRRRSVEDNEINSMERLQDRAKPGEFMIHAVNERNVDD